MQNEPQQVGYIKCLGKASKLWRANAIDGNQYGIILATVTPNSMAPLQGLGQQLNLDQSLYVTEEKTVAAEAGDSLECVCACSYRIVVFGRSKL